jgi:hypothetical protein
VDAPHHRGDAVTSIQPLWAGAVAAVLVVVAGSAVLRGVTTPMRDASAGASTMPGTGVHPASRQNDVREAARAHHPAPKHWRKWVAPLVAGPRRRRWRRQVEHDLPQAIDLLVSSVRAGLTPFQAVGELARSAPPSVRPGFGEVIHLTERGHPFPSALGALAEQLGPRAALVADVVAAADRDGLPLGPVLDQLADEARDSRRRLDEAAARQLPVRLSFPLVSCTLPSFVLLAIVPAVMAALSSLGDTAW